MVLDKVIIVIPKNSLEAIQIAAKDLFRYLQNSTKRIDVRICSADKVRDEYMSSNLILIGNKECNELIRNIRKESHLAKLPNLPGRYYEMTGYRVAELGNGFAITAIRNPKDSRRVIILLEGEDLLGIQYAIYDFAEHVIGVRYLNPYFDYIPKQDKLKIEPINIVEIPDFPLRRIEIWNFNTGSESWDNKRGKPIGRINRNYKKVENDPALWHQNALLGDITMMKKVVDWLIKNKQNVITWVHEHFSHWPPVMPREYTEYEVMRGLKIFAYLSPGSNHIANGLRLSHAEYFAENTCRPFPKRCDDPKKELYEMIPFEFHHFCYCTEAFWKQLETEIDWYERPENKNRSVVGYSLYYGEGTCAYPAFCMDDKKKQSCIRCGHIPNWQKRVDTIKKTKEMLEKRGRFAPVGIVDFGCASSGVPPDDDIRYGVHPEWDAKLISNVPGPNNYFSLRPPGDHTYEEMNHYWGLVKKRNKREGTHLSIFKEGESEVMMASDLPILSPFYFETREHDFKALVGDSVTIGHDTNYFSSGNLGWLKHYWVLRSQWKFVPGWQKGISVELDHLFGNGVGREYAKALVYLSRVLSQELVWEKTPYNHTAEDWRGIHTRWLYLYDIFINLSFYPGDGKELMEGGHYRTFTGGYPTRFRCKVRPFERFYSQELESTEKDMLHYLCLLEECEKNGENAKARVMRNKDFFEEEFVMPLSQSIVFLRWRLQAVIGYCRYLKARKAFLSQRKNVGKKFLVNASEYLEDAIETMKIYQKRAPKRKEWSDCKPLHRQALKIMSKMLNKWQREYKSGFHNEEIKYLELFTDELQASLFR